MKNIEDLKAKITESLKMLDEVASELSDDVEKPISKLHENSITYAVAWNEQRKEVEQLINKLALSYDNVGSLAASVSARGSEYESHHVEVAG